MRRVGIFEAKTKLSALVAEIMSEGETFHITKHGRVVAELRPPGEAPTSRLRGGAAGPGFWISDDFDSSL